MRLVNYLNENTDDEILELLFKNCSEYFNKIDGLGMRLFRASNINFSDPYKKIIPRQNREPKDLPKEIHTFLDDILDQKFSWKPRSQGVFAQGNSSVGLKAYGEIHYFFPLNGWKFCWNKKRKDIMLYLKQTKQIRKSGNKYVINKDDWQTFLTKEVQNYRNTNFKKACYSVNELMFYCPYGYYLVKQDWIKQYLKTIFPRG